MTTESIVATCTGITSIIASITAAVIALRNSAKTDAVKAQVDGVKVQVDGNLSRVTSALAVEVEANKGHIATIAALTSAKKDAQEVAMKVNEPPPPVTNPPAL